MADIKRIAGLETAWVFRILMFTAWVWGFLLFRNDYLNSSIKTLRREARGYNVALDTLPQNTIKVLYDAINGDMTVNYRVNNRTYSILKKEEPAFLKSYTGAEILAAPQQGYGYGTEPLQPAEGDSLLHIPSISFERNPRNPYKFEAQVAIYGDYKHKLYYYMCGVRGFYKSEAGFRQALQNPDYAATVYSALSGHHESFAGSWLADSLRQIAGPVDTAMGKPAFLPALYGYLCAREKGFKEETPYKNFVTKMGYPTYAQVLYGKLTANDVRFKDYFSRKDFFEALETNEVYTGQLQFLTRSSAKKITQTDSVPVFNYVGLAAFKQLLKNPDYRDKFYLAYKTRYNLGRRGEFDFNVNGGLRYGLLVLKQRAHFMEQRARKSAGIMAARDAKMTRPEIQRFLGWAILIIAAASYIGRILYSIIKANYFPATLSHEYD